MTLRIHEASAAELEAWDAHVVAGPQGNVHQSRAWAAYRGAFGWQPRFLVADDGARILALTRAWPVVGRESAYLSRGPVPAPDPVTTLARLQAVAGWLAERGAAVVASDAEVPADSGYPELLAAAGFQRIEELQPSRHRLAVDLTGVTEPADLLARFSATTRNMIRAAERTDLRIVRFGPLSGPATDGSAADGPAADGPTTAGPTAGLLAELDVLYGSMQATAERRGFGLASRPRFLDWSRRAFVDGHLVYIGVHDSSRGARRQGRPSTGTAAAGPYSHAARRPGRAPAQGRSAWSSGGGDQGRPGKGSRGDGSRRCRRPPGAASRVRRAGPWHVDLQGIASVRAGSS